MSFVRGIVFVGIPIVRFVQRDMYGRDARRVMQHSWGCVWFRGVRLCAVHAVSAVEIREERRALCGGARAVSCSYPTSQ